MFHMGSIDEEWKAKKRIECTQREGHLSQVTFVFLVGSSSAVNDGEPRDRLSYRARERRAHVRTGNRTNKRRCVVWTSSRANRSANVSKDAKITIRRRVHIYFGRTFPPPATFSLRSGFDIAAKCTQSAFGCGLADVEGNVWTSRLRL